MVAESALTELSDLSKLWIPKMCAQIFAHIVELFPSLALENVWLHTAESQVDSLLHLSNLASAEKL